jgi:hypothetical protein
MRGAIPPLSQYTFMAWCLVKQVRNRLFRDLHAVAQAALLAIKLNFWIPSYFLRYRAAEINSSLHHGLELLYAVFDFFYVVSLDCTLKEPSFTVYCSALLLRTWNISGSNLVLTETSVLFLSPSRSSAAITFPWSTVLQKLIFSQLLNKFPALYWTWISIVPLAYS